MEWILLYNAASPYLYDRLICADSVLHYLLHNSCVGSYVASGTYGCRTAVYPCVYSDRLRRLPDYYNPGRSLLDKTYKEGHDLSAEVPSLPVRQLRICS